jgi:DNA-nicking Smr family endonuclease
MKTNCILLRYFLIDFDLTKSLIADMENHNLKLVLVIGGTGAQGSPVVKGTFSTWIV